MKQLQHLKKMALVFFAILTISFLNAQTPLGSLQFDGINNFVEVAPELLDDIDEGDFTLEAWIKGEKSASQEDHPMIFSNRGGTSNGLLFFFHGEWGGSQYKMLSIQLNGFNYKIVNNGTYNDDLLDGECHHVAISRSGTKLSFYADGILFGTNGLLETSISVASDKPLWIGKDKPTNNTFNGIISQCRIWNIARTAAAILEDKDRSLQGDEAGLIAYWEMKEGTGQIVEDKTNQYEGRMGSTDSADIDDPSWSNEGCIELTTSTTNLKTISIEVYPNPVEDLLFIQHKSEENIQYDLMDAAGKLLFSSKADAILTKVDFHKYPSGIYFIHIYNQEAAFVQKVIKL